MALTLFKTVCSFMLLYAVTGEGQIIGTASHPCLRNCTNSQREVCEYTFVVEMYYTMSKACYDCPTVAKDCDREQCIPADGASRLVVVANRKLPGPAIEVCEGDQLIIDVVNRMGNGADLSIHWHGISQKGTPYMDGVGMLTQCPIIPHTTWRYNFLADSAGTHWWHGHVGLHRAQGLYGFLIVRQDDQKTPNRHLYDYDLTEHLVLLSDWFHRSAVDISLDANHRGADNAPKSLLINGKFSGWPAASSISREVFHVEKDFRYRFRIVSSVVTNTPLKVSVDGHNLTIIASDGGDVEPVEVDALVIYGGERYDIVLNALQDDDSYWFRVKGYGIGMDLNGLAVVRYRNASNRDPMASIFDDREGVVYQEWNKPPSETVITVNQLIALENVTLPQKDKRTIYLAYDFSELSDPRFNDPDLYPLGPDGPGYGDVFNPQINLRAFTFTDYPPLSQFDDERNTEDICDVESVDREHCSREFCICPQIIQVELDQTVEIVLVDESKITEVVHPLHLHGNSFRVLAQAKLGTHTTRDYVIQMDENGEIERNFDRPPEKDTVATPSAGYTVLQFVADNPGWWFLHCHLEFHLETGMAVVVRVGNQDDLPSVPEKFPQCGDFTPTTRLSSPRTALVVWCVLIVLAIVVGLPIIMLLRTKRTKRKENQESSEALIPLR